MINLAFTLYYWLLIARVLISWIRPKTYNPQLRNILRFIYNWTEPLLSPIRERMPSTGGIDFSPLIALLLLSLAQRLLYSLLFF